jgi:endogenous inhibitor of DNA gyrase (YacG/DUF329 family)
MATFWYEIQDGSTARALIALLLALLSMVVAVISVRCPRCGAPWLWIAISKKDIRSWGKWLFYMTECPVCGGGSGSAKAASKPENG